LKLKKMAVGVGLVGVFAASMFGTLEATAQAAPAEHNEHVSNYDTVSQCEEADKYLTNSPRPRGLEYYYCGGSNGTDLWARYQD
jgi:hypothetical protein